MHVELLNVRIFLFQNTIEADAIGNHRNVWKEYYTCYATVSAEAGSQMTEAGLVVDDSHLDFTVRWCGKTKAITSTGFRLSFQNEYYDIIGVDHMSYKRKAIKLKCKKVSR